MKHFFLIVLTSLFLFSCKKEGLKATNGDSTKVEQKSENDSSQLIFKNELNVQTFHRPKEINSCFCGFALNEKDFKEDKLIYIDGADQHAYLKINGDSVKISNDKIKDDFEGDELKINVKNNQYDVFINAKKSEESSLEAAFYDGTIFIKDKENKKVFESLIYGECGC